MANFKVITGLFLQGILVTICVHVHNTVSQGVDFAHTAETCSANFVTQDFQDKWEDQLELSIYGKQWDITLASKSFIYITASNLYRANRFESFFEHHYAKSCFQTTRINGWVVTNTTGYGKQPVTLKMKPTNIPTLFTFAMPYGPNGASTGTATIVLTDNANFNAFEYCFDNKLRAFAVYSKGPLSDENKHAVKLHLKAIGFLERHFVELSNTDDQFCTADESIPPVPQPQEPEDLPKAAPAPPPPPPPPAPIKIVTSKPTIAYRYIYPRYLPQAPSYFWKKK